MEERPKFFALYKDPNNGGVCHIDVLDHVFYDFLNENDEIIEDRFWVFDNHTAKVPNTRKLFSEFLMFKLRSRFWGRSEWEFVIVDWPNRERVSDSKPHKIDVWDQIEPNFEVVLSLAWNYIAPKVVHKNDKRKEV